MPDCSCHGEPMYWHKKKDMLAGGLWRCRVRRKALDASRWQGYYHERMPTEVRLRHALATARARRAQTTARARSRVNKLGGTDGSL